MNRNEIPFSFSEQPEQMIEPGDRVVEITSEIGSERELFEALAGDLSFPDYFGHNWDALDECLGDLSWISEKRIVFIHRGLPSVGTRVLTNYLEALATTVYDEPRHGHKVVAVFPPDTIQTVRLLLPLPIKSRWE